MKNIRFKNLFFDQSPSYDGLKSFLGSTEVVAYFDTVIHISSLPLQRPAFKSSELMINLNIKSDNILTIGDNCACIIDALEIAQSDYSRHSSTLIVADDEFAGFISESAKMVKPGLIEWRNAKSAIVLNRNNHDVRFRTNRRASKCSPEFAGIIEFDNQGMLVVNESLAKAFKIADIESEIKCVSELLSCERKAIGDYDAIVLVNREHSRAAKFSDALGCSSEKMYSSRETIGHTGASDIVFNLIQAIKASDKQRANILISASGLGYIWRCISLSVENISDL